MNSRASAINIQWDKTAEEIYASLRPYIRPLRAFLEGNETKLGQILAGRSMEQTCTETETFELELQLLAQLEKGMTPATLAKWFLVLYRLIQVCNKEPGYELFASRIPVVPPPIPSPFRPARVQLAQSARTLRNHFVAWLASNPALDNQELAAAAVLSSILYGGLLERNAINGWAKLLHQPIPVAGSLAYVEFRAPFRGLPESHLQRWFLDPVTQFIFLRLENQGNPYFTRDDQVWRGIRQILTECGIAEDPGLSSMASLIDASVALWETQASMVDALFGRRKLRTHSLRPDVFLRLFHCAPEVTKTRGAATKPPKADQSALEDTEQRDNDAVDVEAAALIPGWYRQIDALLDNSDSTLLLEGVRAIAADLQDSDPGMIYLHWLEFMLENKSGSTRKMAVDTARKYFRPVTTQLTSILGEQSPISLTDDELIACYSALLLDLPAGSSHTKLAKGLREFQHYLHKQHDRPDFQSIKEVLGSEAELRPVEANLITEDEAVAVRKWIGEQSLRSKEFRQATQVAFSLLRGSAGRRMEFLGCQVGDIHIEGRAVFLIRPHAERGLKTKNSMRNAPLEILLPKDELNELLAWQVKRREEERTRPTKHQYLFSIPDEDYEQLSPDAISDFIHEALREVIGDKTLHQHIVRHSQATWVYLALRAKDYPRLKEIFQDQPLTHMKLAQSSRLRVRLIGSHSGPSRAYGFATSRILGHSSPLVSWQHYIHCSDFILHAIAWRETEKIGQTKLAKIACIPESTADDAMKRGGLNALLISARKRAPQRINTMPAIQKPSAPLGRPPLKIEWIPLDKVQAIIDFANRDNQSEAAISETTGLAPERIGVILHNATTWAADLGIEFKSTQKKSPLTPHGDNERTFRAALEDGLQRLAAKEPRTLKTGIDFYFKYFNSSIKDVAFHGKTSLQDTKRFIQFALSLGISPESIRLVLRCNGDNQALFEDRKRSLRLPDGIRPHFVPLPVKSKESTYRKWTGIAFFAPNTGKGLMNVTATTMLLARISLSVT